MATGIIKTSRDSEIDSLKTNVDSLKTTSNNFFNTGTQVTNTTKEYALTSKRQYLLIVSHPTKTDVGLYLIDAYSNSGSKVAPIKTSSYATVSINSTTLSVTTSSDVFLVLKEIGKWSK